MSDTNDIEVVDRVLAGDIEAFSEIITRYHNKVFRYAYSKVYNYDEALDITQEIFVMTMEALKSFRKEAKFSTWLFSIMVNYCKNYRKKAERFSTVALSRTNGEDEFEIPITDERQNQEQEVIDRDSLRIVKEELYRLPEDYKEILILRDIEGLPYNDIARVTGINLSNVKVRIHRGRELLKKRLAERGLL
jgi:RNA polymerase sigma-70 factor (ECF subfamily)